MGEPWNYRGILTLRLDQQVLLHLAVRQHAPVPNHAPLPQYTPRELARLANDGAVHDYALQKPGPLLHLAVRAHDRLLDGRLLLDRHVVRD